MKLPRMTVRNLMLAVLAFAVAWWSLQTWSRWDYYNSRVSWHVRREGELRILQGKLIRMPEMAADFLRIEKGQRTLEDALKFDTLFDDLDENKRVCPSIRFGLGPPLTAFYPADWDDRLNKQVALAREILPSLEPKLAYHARLREKYERAKRCPWRVVPTEEPLEPR